MAYLGRDDTPVPTKGRGSKLTGKQLRFVEEYMVDCNASKAVIRAGYKTTTQNRLGVELMRHPLIKKEINERLDNRKRMPDNLVDLTVTSPPYDNLRDYKGYSFPFEDIAKEEEK